MTPVGRCFADTSHSLKQKQETCSREEFLQSTTDQRAVERMFENAIQACSDLAHHIATRAFGSRWGCPRSIRECI
ncbi:HepT-like ribonuclease domain-containing protein [Salinigranum halophilum]|uniref:HepT-like ribonuclease domain-containing protein n=1 Tax=Salinigranum halophilum TaxID=2565931 RepID=UPI00191BE679|nr:HepT-like ribonuclease domain-containing protein [Salinigranum halophilum]